MKAAKGLFFSLIVFWMLITARTPAATIIWTNTAGGNWNVTANWNPNQLPTGADDVFITNAGTYAITLNVTATNNTLTLGGPSGTQSLTNNSFTLMLNSVSVVNSNGAIVLGGGTLAGVGDLTVNGKFFWISGTISGPAVTTIASGGQLTLSGAFIKNLNTRTLVNAGSATWSGGTFNFQTGGVFSNAPGGTFDCASDNSTANNGGGPIANAGLFRKTAGTGSSTFTVTFNNSGTVNVQSGTFTLNAPGTDTGSYAISSGAILDFINGARAINAGSVTGPGTFSASGAPLNFNGNYTFTNVTLAMTAGTLTFDGTGTASPTTFNFTNGTLAGTNNVTVTGPMNWTGGILSGSNSTVTANGGLNLTGLGDKSVGGRMLINVGTGTLSAGRFNFQVGGIFSNAATATFDCTSDAPPGAFLNNSGGPAVNAGIFRKSAGTNSVIGVPFNNSGTLEIQSGVVSLNNGGTSTGSFNVSANTTLQLGGGTHNFSVGSTVSGAGNFSVSGGTANLSGSLGVGGTNAFSGGIANFSGSYTISGGTVNVSGSGTANFNGNGTVAPALLLFSAGTIGGTNTVTVAGPMIWTGGTITGSNAFFANGGLTLSGSADKSVGGRTLVNTGAATMNGSGRFNFQPGGIFSNALGATFDISTDALFLLNGGGPINNVGTFRKLTGTNTVVQMGLNNSGTVEVQSGTLSLQGAGTNTGVFTVPIGSTLELAASGTTLLTGNSTISGAGNFTVNFGTVNLNGALFVSGTNSFSSGTANFAGTYAISNGTLNILGGAVVNFNGDGVIAPALLNLNGGTLGGTNSVTVNGPMIWNGGTITGTNSVTANGGLTLNGANRTLTGRTLNNTSNAIWTAGIINMSGGALLINSAGATFDIALDSSLNGASVGTFINAGQLRKTAGTGNTTISPAFTNSGTVEIQSGTLQFSGPPYIQTAGLTLLNGGNLSDSANLQIRGGTLAGNGLITGPLTNSGVVSPGLSPGQLIFSSTYTQTTNGVLNIELAGAPTTTNYDRLVVTNAATLAGSIVLTLTNGFYPAPDVIFTNVLLAASRSGTFSAVYYPSNIVGLQVNYGSSNVDVEVINTIPHIPPISSQTIDELTALSFNINASDADAPAQTLTYSLLNSPTNASIDSSGLIQWTPTEAQGPMTTNITVVVTDNGTPNLTSNQTFQVTVREINVAPTLNLPSTQTINELATLNVNATVTDPDIPTNTFTFTKISGPAALTVSPSGAISWTTTEADGPSTNTVTISVTDTNSPAINTTSFSVTNSFTLTVSELNVPPVLTLPTNQTINELVFYTNNATATDADLPANPLTFALVSGPTGMVVSASGAITWTPSEFQGPSTNVIQVRVTDTNPPAINATSLSITNSFTLTVSEVNVAPVVGALSNQSGNAGQTISFTATATDADLPTNTLSFSLVSPPAGASIVAGSGLFSWRLPASLANTTNLLRVRVTDNGNPNLSGTNSFNVTINPILPVRLTPLSYTNSRFTLQATGSIGPDYVLQASTAFATWTNLVTNTPGTMPFSITDSNAGLFSNRFYRVLLQP